MDGGVTWTEVSRGRRCHVDGGVTWTDAGLPVQSFPRSVERL